ncbi:leucine-rich repeat domain-containing protein [Rudanella lutea]|uniref:leucine-rich repeat domain-containing protein n=1 Tax=Rudanella lutea TaxID=451374 RepID=UPI00036B648C|nr:leucine-rich repeat domain-containing protein [Rudanella lutea]
MDHRILLRIEAVANGHTDTLKLDNLHLTELPDTVFDLRHLRVLSVCGFGLKSHGGIISLLEKVPVPGSAELAEELKKQEEDLQNELKIPRQLRSLDARIGQLKSLEVLDLGYNQLDYLPDTLGDLPNLRKLIVRNNLLSSVPASLSQLPKLELLDIRHNPIETLPDIPQLLVYEEQKKHFRQQKNLAIKQNDFELATWFYKQETQFGLHR